MPFRFNFDATKYHLTNQIARPTPQIKNLLGTGNGYTQRQPAINFHTPKKGFHFYDAYQPGPMHPPKKPR